MASMAEIGEKAFLRGLLPQLHQADGFVNGFGHDASILDLGLERYLAFKIDRAPTPVALTRGWCDHKVWGRLAVVANISDLLASGASPRALMLSLVVPREYDSQAVADIVAGCQESCEQHGVAFVGGDTKEGTAVQVVGAAIGTVDKSFYLGRKSASPGDHLVVAGKLGAFAGAMSLLDADVVSARQKMSLLSTLTLPTARTLEATYLTTTKLPHAACDLSDGLADAIGIFCSPGIGITIDVANLPLHENVVEAAATLGMMAHKFAFSVGDWAITYLVSGSNIDRLFRDAPPGLELFDLGCFDDSGLIQLRMENGEKQLIPATINEHFRSRLEDDAEYLSSLLSEKKEEHSI